MFKIKNLPLTISSVVVISLIVGWGISMVFAWIDPTLAPPSGNVAAPINVSSTAQTKAGNLNIGGGLNYWITKNGDSFALQNNASVINLMVGQDGAFSLRELSSSPGATANYGNLYVKTDGNVYFKNDAGTEFNLSGAVAGSSLWTRSGTNTYLTNTGDNVGIGDTSPAYKLSVDGTASISGTLYTDGSIVAGGSIRAGGYFYGGTDNWIALAGDTNVYLDIDDDNDGTNALYIRDGANNILMTVTEAGNIGIGTTSPGVLLDAVKSSTSNVASGAPLIRSQNTNATAGDGSTTYNFASLRAVAGNAAISGDLLAAYNTAGSLLSGIYLRSINAFPLIFQTSSTERMRITSTGNVGIGTTTPGYKLTVSGGAIGGNYGLLPNYAAWNAYGVGDGGAAIYNDNGVYKALMIVGSDQATGFGRVVKVWDSLQVQGTLFTTGSVGIGTTTITSPAKLQIDGDGLTIYLPRKSTAGDPTGANGMIYYNASSNRFRCYQNGSWVNCTGTGSGSIGGSGTLNRIPKFSPDGSTLANSIAAESAGTEIRVTGNVVASAEVHSGNGKAVMQVDGSIRSDLNISSLQDIIAGRYFCIGGRCIDSWCDLNDFSWCVPAQDDFSPVGVGGTCFAGGTQILMADNSYKSIENVKEGDWILTKESEKSNKMVSVKVAKTFEHEVNGYLIINNKLKVTEIHPIFVAGTQNKWKQAWTIRLGNKLLNEKGEEVVVESLESKKETIKVYNLEVEVYGTYFAGGIYVHNKPVLQP